MIPILVLREENIIQLIFHSKKEWMMILSLRFLSQLLIQLLRDISQVLLYCSVVRILYLEIG